MRGHRDGEEDDDDDDDDDDDNADCADSEMKRKMMIMMMIMMIMMIISPPLQGEAASVNSEREVVPRTAQQCVRQAQQLQYEWKLTKNIIFFYYLVHLALVAPLTSANGPVFKHKIICE